VRAYEEVSSVQVIPAVRDRDPIPERYRRVKEEIETTLLGADAGGAVGPSVGARDLRARYEAATRGLERAVAAPTRPAVSSTSGARRTSGGSP